MTAKVPHHDQSLINDSSDDEPIMQEYSRYRDESSKVIQEDPPRVNRERQYPKLLNSDYMENNPDEFQPSNMFSLNIESSSNSAVDRSKRTSKDMNASR